jgi:hypothetical protein
LGETREVRETREISDGSNHGYNGVYQIRTIGGEFDADGLVGSILSVDMTVLII